MLNKNQPQEHDAETVALAISIRTWWEGNKNATSDNGERNVFHREPPFVEHAKKVLGNWECLRTAAQLQPWDGTRDAANALLATALASQFSAQAIEDSATALLRDEVCDIDESREQFQRFVAELKTYNMPATCARIASDDVRLLIAKYGLLTAP